MGFQSPAGWPHTPRTIAHPEQSSIPAREAICLAKASACEHVTLRQQSLQPAGDRQAAGGRRLDPAATEGITAANDRRAVA